MNTPQPGVRGLLIPAEMLSVEIVVDDNGDAAYSCASTSKAHEIVGDSTGYGIFGEPGWTREKFTLFVMSRQHMHIEF